MKTIEQLLSRLNDENVTIKIFGKSKTIIGMSDYKTHNYGDDGYTKVVFDDKSFLMIVPGEGELYYSDEYIIDTGIADNDIGNKKSFIFNGKVYELGNKDDYQYVVKNYKGGVYTIEGEVKFSDYFPKHGEKEFLSLGREMRTGKRADVNPKLIYFDNIDF